MYAKGGYTTAQVKAEIDAWLASYTSRYYWPTAVLVNLGSNDFSLIHNGTLTQAAWETDMGYIMDAIHATWPETTVLLARPVWYGYDAEHNAFNDTWIPTVIAPRSSWSAVGPDERLILSYPSSTMTDPTHPSASGYSLMEDKWLELIPSPSP